MRRSLCLTLVFLLLLVGTAAAHSPIFLPDNTGSVAVQTRQPIVDPEKSWAVYGRLPAGAAVDLIPVHAERGQKLYLQMLVPAKKGLESFRPRVVLLGPGLEGSIPADLPVPVPPAGQGVLMLPEPAVGTPFFEEFTQTSYRMYGDLESTFPRTGDYLVLVYDPAGKGGPYTVAIGKREEFGLRDLLTFPLTWVRVHLWLCK